MGECCQFYVIFIPSVTLLAWIIESLLYPVSVQQVKIIKFSALQNVFHFSSIQTW